MSSSNRSHRPQSDRPSLKQRAAELEAGLARVTHRPAPAPETMETLDPAFEVAASYRAAWDALGEAMEAKNGEEAPEAEDACAAAYARLRAVRPTTPAGFQALAETWAWRLRAERATPATGSDGTHTVGADAAESLIAGAGVCVPTVASGGGDDAVHVLIAEHRAAYTAWDQDAKVYDGIVPGSAGYEAAGAAERASGQRERAAYEALFLTRPRTLAGVLALVDYLSEAVPKVTTHVGPTEGGRALGAVAAALRGLEPARAALTDVGLTSEVSEDVFAAIEDHRDVMAATAALAEDNEEFDRQGQMQNAAEAAVAHAPVRSLADLRAKLTYLLPIIAPDMLDKTHVRHLEAIQADMDRLCRERSRPADTHEDAELLLLGERLDRAHARWRITTWQYREPEARLKRALEDARARGGPTLRQLEAAWSLPGVEAAHEAEEAAFGALGPICDAIWLIPACTPAGLAVKARAALVHIWARGQFEEDAALGEEEGLTKEAARRLIEACCTLAGVDWRGDPIAPPLPDPIFSAIERHLAARAACVGLDDGVDE
ncbi:hypothetical protein ASG32_27300 [Methylobacterium sp. Leaf361]|uniref:hypothetical protein n=1 Tax=Methylobacterium sp. Leaf361 TaxID=1736352 RepID=UPI0006FD5F28|nr:hypothetical protein [Methylobacterium sp. Leaf361]KQS75473.1 hypothetical protein ASG32_27300 [Methylobacterium sp. Leaf361]